jgi:hypothetical protein
MRCMHRSAIATRRKWGYIDGSATRWPRGIYMLIVQTAAALFFIACLIGILAYAMLKGVPESSQRIARFLASLCAGLAAFMIPGSALLQISQNLSAGGSLAINGTAGVALFLIVFLFWGKVPQPNKPVIEDGPTTFTFPSGTTFNAAALQLTQEDKCGVDLKNFSSDEANSRLLQELTLSTPVPTALKALRSGLWSNPIHAYDVNRNGGTYELM